MPNERNLGSLSEHIGWFERKLCGRGEEGRRIFELFVQEIMRVKKMKQAKLKTVGLLARYL